MFSRVAKKSSMSVLILLGALFLCSGGLVAAYGSYSSEYFRDDMCGTQPNGIEWILSKRHENYGWGPHTPRAIIALFTGIAENKTYVSEDEKALMVNQLEVELAIALLRYTTSSTTGQGLSQSELSYYIHALLIVGRNPRNFKGLNLVQVLQQKFIDHNLIINPFTVLCLCNAGVKDSSYLSRLSNYLLTKKNGSIINVETSAISIKAFACYGTDLPKDYENKMNSAVAALLSYQKADGSFGNNFTTSVVIQALKPFAEHYDVVKEAMDFLERQKCSRLEDIYYIEMALRQFIFIRDYHIFQDDVVEQDDGGNKVSVNYAVKFGLNPDWYITLTMKVPVKYTWLDVMKLAETKHSAVNFSHSLMKNGNTPVYSIGNLANNAEDGHYWRLYKRMKTDTKGPRLYEQFTTPKEIVVHENADYIYLYKSLFEL